MPVLVSPGVEVREIDLSQYARNLSTTIVGMVGTATKGPINERTLITNQQEFVRTFGQRDTASLGTFAAIEYLRRGNQLWYVRVADSSESKSTIDIPGVATAGVITGSVTEPYSIVLATNDVLDIKVDGGVSQPITLTAGATQTAADIVADLSVLTGATASVVAGAVVITSDSFGTTSSIEIEATSTADATLGFDNLVHSGTGDPTTTLTVDATSEGTWADGYQIVIADGTQASTFKITVYDTNGNQINTYDNLTKGPADTRFHETIINDDSIYIDTVDAALNIELPANGTYVLAGGDNGTTAIAADDYVGTITGTTKTGLQLLNASDVDVNVIAVPGVSDAGVVQAMLSLCEERGDCMALIDPPLGLGVTDVADWHNGEGVYSGQHTAFNSNYGALYWPWLKVLDPVSGTDVWLPPSGHLAAVYAYNDQIAYSWFAPAGLNRGKLLNVKDIEFETTVGDRNFLYGGDNAVNNIASLKSSGIAVWGQKTLQREATALDRVNVRRLLLYLRKVIATAVETLLFEPNDSTTWARFTGLIRPLMDHVLTNRGVYEYLIKCDGETNSEFLVENNTMRAEIYIRPTKTAEIIQVDLILTSQGAVFEEILGSQ